MRLCLPPLQDGLLAEAPSNPLRAETCWCMTLVSCTFPWSHGIPRPFAMDTARRCRRRSCTDGLAVLVGLCAKTKGSCQSLTVDC